MQAQLLPGEFLLKDIDERGVYVAGWFEGENMHYQTRQMVPDQLFTENKERDQDWSPNGKRTSHYQQFARIPSVLMQKWKQEFGVDNIHEDDDVKKKIMQRLNSNEFHKLRTGGGNL